MDKMCMWMKFTNNEIMKIASSFGIYKALYQNVYSYLGRGNDKVFKISCE